MPSHKSKVVVFGSIVHDLISYTDHFPRPGESVRGNAFVQGPGGKGANQAVAAALLGADVAMIGKVGDDIFADFNKDSMKKAGVDETNVEKCPGKNTATATITVDAEGENSIVVTLGANLELTPSTADEHESLIGSASIVMCQAEIAQAANRRAFELARKHGVTTFFNPAPGDKHLDTSILSLVNIVCTNENEAEFITGIAASNPKEAEKAGRKMIEMGPHTAIITLGPAGCVVVWKNEKGEVQAETVPTETVKAVDTTGAGDCFCGSLAALLAGGKLDIIESTRRASRIASISVLKKGTQLSYSSREEIMKMGKGDLVKDI